MNFRLPHEPTMEEILASIRKIASEDASEGDAPDQEAAPAGPAPIKEYELERPRQVVEPPVATVPSPASVHVPADDLVLNIVAPARASAEHSDIFSDQTRSAMADTFNAIPDEPVAPAQAAHRAAPLTPVNGLSVENVFERAVRESFEPVMQKHLSDNSAAVIDLMKPLIREWMDEHFPSLLECTVRSEVALVMKSRGGKR